MSNEQLEPDGSYNEAIGHIFVSQRKDDPSPTTPPDFTKNVLQKLERQKGNPRRDTNQLKGH